MLKRIISGILAILLMVPTLLFSSGCADENYPVTVAGILIEQRPECIVCLNNDFTEIIVDMGYTNLLSGRSAECTLPDVQTIPACGTADSPSTDVLVSMGCDLLIVGIDSPTEELIAVAELGINVMQLMTPSDRLGFINLYRCLGAAMDGRIDGYNTGDKAATDILVQLDDVERAVSAESDVSICIFTDAAMTRAVTGDMLGNMIIDLSGGFNITVSGKKGIITLADVAQGNPEVILCRDGDENTVIAQRTLEDCGAVKNNRIYGYDTSKLSTLGGDLVEAAWELARLMHPDLITAADLPGNATDYIPDFSEAVIDGGQAYLDYVAEQEAIAAEKEAANS